MSGQILSAGATLSGQLLSAGSKLASQIKKKSEAKKRREPAASNTNQSDHGAVRNLDPPDIHNQPTVHATQYEKGETSHVHRDHGIC